MMSLIESLATTEPLAEIFSDQSVLHAALDFEVALARVEARLGIIPQPAAETIASAAQTHSFDIPAMARAMQQAATIGVPLAEALTDAVRAKDPDAAKFVHWGATSQDVADTAIVLLLKRAQPVLVGDLCRIEAALESLSNQHADTVLLGRTLLQAAPPVTFGLKVAGWLGSMTRSRVRLENAFAEALIVQFGGAAGTLAALGNRGQQVGSALGAELNLRYPEAPWHAHRDRLAALICACGVLTGSLGKMARDITLMSQGEVAEMSEPSGTGRGGSSTMPQKRNPVGSVIALAAANRIPGLVASFLCAMVQEHERAAGGWQSEWPTVATVIQGAGAAAASMAGVVEGLTVDAPRMRKNIEATRGSVFAERAMMLLAPALGRDVALKLVEQATRKSASEGKSLAQTLRGMPEVANVLDDTVLATLDDPSAYLGSAGEFRKRLLVQSEAVKK